MVWIVRRSQGFAEVLVLGQPLASPSELPAKYAHRSTKVGDMGGRAVYEVSSAVFAQPVVLNAPSLVAQGIWIVPADARPMGAIPDEGVLPVVAVLGMPLAHTEQELQQVCACVRGEAEGTPDLVLYHGTSTTAWSSIQTSGLQESQGMLGLGVYVGSFWKATRFAARNQTYQLRKQGEALVVRVYCFCPALQDWTAKTETYACACTECSKARDVGGAARERSVFTDHESRWALNTECSGVYMPSRKSHHDPSQWIVRNPEWCLRSACCRIQNAALLDMSSVVHERYDPLQRSQRIL
jgi:hypothetical protein